MRRILCLICALSLVLSLAGCGGETPAAQAPAGERAVTETTAGDTAPAETMETVPFEEVTLLETGEAAVRVLSVECTDADNILLQIELTNNGQEELMYGVETVTVNGVTMDSQTFTPVPPGQSHSYYSPLHSEAFGLLDMGPVTSLEVKMILVDSGFQTLDQGTLTYYPYGEENSVPFAFVPSEAIPVLFDTELASAYLLGCSQPADGGGSFTMNLYLVNHSGQPLFARATDCTIMGVDAEGHMGANVPAGGGVLCSVLWMESDLMGAGISQIQDITSFGLRLELQEMETYSIVLTSNLTLTASGTALTYTVADAQTSTSASVTLVGAIPQMELEPVVLADTEDYKFELRGMTVREGGLVDLALHIENRTTDRNLLFSLDYSVFSNFQTTSGMMLSAAPGTVQDTVFTADASFLEGLGITKVSLLEFAFSIRDQNGGDILFETLLPLYPYGEENAQKLQVNGGLSLFESQYGKAAFVTSFWKEGMQLQFYVQNRTEEPLTFCVAAQVNDTDVSLDRSEFYIQPGRGALLVATIPTSELTPLGITAPTDPILLAFGVLSRNAAGETLDSGGLRFNING